jgi:hypothetical protein
MILHKPFIHSLMISKRPHTYGWISPAEVSASSPQDVSFAAPVDLRGRFNFVYYFDVFKYGRNGQPPALQNYPVVLVGQNTMEVTIAGKLLIFREKRRNSRQRSFPYLGKFDNPDFQYRLVEIEPDPFDLVDELFLSSGLVLIGCDPSSHYRGWSAIDGNPPKALEKSH